VIELFGMTEKDPDGKFEDALKFAVLKARIFYLDSDIDEDMARRFRRETHAMSAGNKEPITIIVCSAGGEATQGFSIISNIRMLQRQGIVINAAIQGDAASMAAIIAATADTCTMTPLSRIMWHGVQFGLQGDLTDMADTKAELNRMTNLISDILFKRVHCPGHKFASKAFLKRVLLSKRATWIYPEDALASGIVDEVVV